MRIIFESFSENQLVLATLGFKIYGPEKDLISKWFPSLLFRTNTQLVNAQTTYANLLQFEIESKRLGNIKGSTSSSTSTGNESTGKESSLQRHRRKKVRSMKLARSHHLLFIPQFIMAFACYECSVTNAQRLRCL